MTHVITGLGRGGAEGFLARLAPVLRDHGVASSVVSLTDSGVHGAPLRRAGIVVRPLGWDRRRVGPLSLRALRSAIRDQRPDVVMTWLHHADLAGGVAARSLRLKVVWNLRQADLAPGSPTRHRVLVALGAAVARLVPHRIVCVSERARDAHVAAGYPPARMSVLYNGVDTERFRPDPAARRDVRAGLGIPPDALVVGHIARVDPQKDHAGAVAAFARVVRERPGTWFLMCGEGVDGRDLHALVDDAGIAAATRLVGPRDDVERVIAACDVVVSSSLNEGLANVLAEAMACEVPCVSTSSGDAEQLLGDTGTVVPPGDPEALAKALVVAIDAARARAGQPPQPSPRARIEAGWTLDDAARRYATLLSEVACRG